MKHKVGDKVRMTYDGAYYGVGDPLVIHIIVGGMYGSYMNIGDHVETVWFYESDCESTKKIKL